MLLNTANNLEAEQNSRIVCSINENQCSNSSLALNQSDQENSKTHYHIGSLYLIIKDRASNKTSLFVYDTEREREEIKVLKTPESLDSSTCITQLPNCELFFFGKYPISGISLVIDTNYEARKMPSGIPCSYSSSIYFKRSVYCFGGYADNVNVLALSTRFDLDWKRWIKLSPMPQSDFSCHSIICNGNILISGYKSRNLWLYTVDIDSFSTIPYDFKDDAKKILIKAERLYLIECSICGLIYESEIGDEYTWKQMTNSMINYYPDQVYCSYNKGWIYIGCFRRANCECYKFSLDKKEVIKLNRNKL